MQLRENYVQHLTARFCFMKKKLEEKNSDILTEVIAEI